MQEVQRSYNALLRGGQGALTFVQQKKAPPVAGRGLKVSPACAVETQIFWPLVQVGAFTVYPRREDEFRSPE